MFGSGVGASAENMFRWRIIEKSGMEDARTWYTYYNYFTIVRIIIRNDQIL